MPKFRVTVVKEYVFTSCDAKRAQEIVELVDDKVQDPNSTQTRFNITSITEVKEKPKSKKEVQLFVVYYYFKKRANVYNNTPSAITVEAFSKENATENFILHMNGLGYLKDKYEIIKVVEVK